MLRAVLLGVLLALTSLACSSSVDRIEPDDAVELTALELDLDLSEQELFEQGKRMYAAGLYALAQQSFERLRNGYPFGAYAEFAEVKIADCHSLLNEHDTAALLYEDFVKEHPASLAAPYALARAGRSQQLSNGGVGRDTTPLKKALSLYDDFLQRYPQSVYAKIVKVHRDQVVADLTEYDLEVLDFYKRRGKTAAYEARMAALKSVYSSVKDARSNIKDMRAKNSSELPKASDTVKANSADGLLRVHYAQRLRGTADTQNKPRSTLAISAKQTTTATQKPASIKTAVARVGSVQPFDIDSGTRIRFVECRASTPQQILIHLDRPPSREVLALDASRINASEGKLAFALPNSSAQAITKDCFALNDLEVAETGAISVRSDSPATVIALSYPPRVVLVLDQAG